MTCLTYRDVLTGVETAGRDGLDLLTHRDVLPEVVRKTCFGADL